MIRLGLLALMALVSAPLRAEWKRAETPHYIIYSEQSEAQLREMAARFEILNKTQRFLTRRQDKIPVIKPVIYVVENQAAVQSVMAFGGSEGVAGYYSSSTRGPFMVTNLQDDDPEFPPQLVAFHEITHYFMFDNFPAAYPAWFTEGLAEFIGTTRILPPNKAEVGRLSKSRYRPLLYFEWLPVSKLVAAHGYGDVDNVLMLYSEGWLLTHYLLIEPAREGQLGKYLAAINQGKSFTDAAKEAFGDLRDLDVELRRYARKRALSTRVLEFKVPMDTEIAISPVPAARQALMMHDIKLMSGIGAKDVAEFAADVRKVAAAFPQDPFALRIRTEAELLADKPADAAAAARQWLAVAPNDPLAMTFLARAEMAALKAAGSKDAAAWNAARARIARAAKLAPKQPLILRAYYRSFVDEGKLPPEDAQNMLYEALELNPADEEIRYELALDYEKRGFLTDAIDLIRVAAYATSEPKSEKDKARQDKERAKYRLAGEELHETPREMLARLQAKAKAAGQTTHSDDDQP